MSFIFEFIASLLEKVGLSWFAARKAKEIANEQNKVVSMSNSAVDDELQSWKRPD